MSEGRVVGIYIAQAGGEPMRGVGSVAAVSGKGLEGDRYFLQSGTYSGQPGSGREVTLVEAEAIEAVRSEEGFELPIDGTRRNLVTRGVALNHLVGREFSVGEVRLRGVRLCEPCATLAKSTGFNIVLPLLHRAGLRADIVSGGRIAVGDTVSSE